MGDAAEVEDVGRGAGVVVVGVVLGAGRVGLVDVDGEGVVVGVVLGVVLGAGAADFVELDFAAELAVDLAAELAADGAAELEVDGGLGSRTWTGQPNSRAIAV